MQSIALIRQVGKPMPLDPIEPESEESRARALDAQESERAEGLAMLLASFNGIHDLHAEPEETRRHFAQWALVAVRGSFLGKTQFRACGLALHAAAAAGQDWESRKELYQPVDLLSPENSYERMHWTQLASEIVRTYLKVLGACVRDTQMAEQVYGKRLQ